VLSYGQTMGSARSPTLRCVLVANRGEIAVRIIRTLRRLGIASVAVYSDADRTAAHVRAADEAVRIGPESVALSYLDADSVIAAALATRADAIHPGYGFLSERADFAERVEAAGLAFIGPTAEQLRIFGDKHESRLLAEAAGVPVLAGSDPVHSVDQARPLAAAAGYPVMLKSTGGGGGIGMAPVLEPAGLDAAFASVVRSAGTNFVATGVIVERLVRNARHVEVQVFGDGTGRVVTLGDRDCSIQRRRQKVIEESPAPDLTHETRTALREAARALLGSVEYRSAGTVEFIVDADDATFSFLEVNARLQVEHPVTELVTGVDLVEWMVRLAGGDAGFLDAGDREPTGNAVEARVYAEDPVHGYRPHSGLLTRVSFPEDVRVDTWIETGTEVTPHYDPLLAKVVVAGSSRNDAWHRLRDALGVTDISGIESNVRFLRALLEPGVLGDGEPGEVVATTTTLEALTPHTDAIDVLDPGTLTTVQAYPGRVGFWDVGIPPSGPMDDLSHRLGNAILGNAADAAGLEATLTGPVLRFRAETVVCVTGAPCSPAVDGVAQSMWEPFAVPAGATLAVGPIGPPGIRAYVMVAGGLRVPSYLGSAATFTLGRFGGHGGRGLLVGDVLTPGREPADPRIVLDPADRPEIVTDWTLATLDGPHGQPEFLTGADTEMLHVTRWKVHHNSARTGVRLIGPRPQWARADGGDAGLHPSNVIDTAYAVGSIDFTGDMPILLGPDGPSLGGFVCPAVVTRAERWKIGQLRPGDTVRFERVGADAAKTLREATDALVEVGERGPTLLREPDASDGPVLGRIEADGDRPAVTYRRDGDDYLLVEYGPLTLDLDLRVRVHTLSRWLDQQHLPGLVDVTPGIRSLQLHVDPAVLSVEDAYARLTHAEPELPAIDDIEVPNRIVHLPLSWDDPTTGEAVVRYMQGVRADAPWCPSNIEFIRRINGLESVEAVRKTVFDASYLVLGLGDVYLGAPAATPIDPRHRLVTTKYNPSRTWTAEGTVGIGGAFLCIYGLSGPGGYQLVGRTVPIWNRFNVTAEFPPGQPWLLRWFDEIRWYPVDPDELLDIRAGFLTGQHRRSGPTGVRIEESTFRLADHHAFLRENAASIDEFRTTQQAAFAEERRAWAASGELDRSDADDPAPPDSGPSTVTVSDGATVVRTPLSASVWKVEVAVGDTVAPGQLLAVLEAMKMETHITAPAGGRVEAVFATAGGVIEAGSPIVAIDPT
jgi:urea carboxylase